MQSVSANERNERMAAIQLFIWREHEQLRQILGCRC